MTNFFTRKKFFPLQPSCIAAMIIVIIIMSIVFYWMRPSAQIVTQEDVPVFNHQRYRNEVEPAQEEARITLKDGAVIVLLDTVNGVLATEGSKRATISKEDGWLIYAPSQINDSVYYNTISVPRSGTFKLKLSDGTRVWLNAGSTIKFALSHGKEARTVWLNGEAYIEVAEMPQALPFVVNVQSAPGKVIASKGGGHFNVMAYEEAHNAYVTAINGSVSISNKVKGIDLVPGQAGFLDQQGRLARIDSVNGSEATAWRYRLFSYKEADLNQIMNQIARSYNVRVDYDQVTNVYYTGVLDFNSPLTRSLQQMENTGKVKFRIEANRVVVMP